MFNHTVQHIRLVKKMYWYREDYKV